jgi:hypothetical protein
MTKKKSKTAISKTLISVCIIAGIATIALRMLSARLKLPELGEIASYTGTVFAISLIIIIGIWIVIQINKK